MLAFCRWSACALLALCAACHHAAPTPAAHAPPPAPLHLGPPSDYVPAAGLRWLLVGAPKRIAESATFYDALALLLPSDRLDAFSKGTGVDLRRVESGLIAGFDLGTLYAFLPPPGTSETVVKRFRERLVSGERIDSSRPELQRISGVVGVTPEALVRVDEQLLAVAIGDPTLARVAEAFARGRLHASPVALKGAALSTLGPVESDALATFYAPGPFSDEWARGAHGLLASALAIRISVAPRAGRRANFVVELSGEFPPSAHDDLEIAFRELSASPLGKLLGLDELENAPTIHEREQRLLLESELDISLMARGLRAAVMADVWEIMDGNAKK